MRLDNVIFCSKLFHTLSFARQWVAHGFFLVDGQKVNIPSYQVKPGQVIGIVERKKDKVFKNKLIKDNLEKDQKIPSYLELDKQKMVVVCHRYPTDKELIELNKNIDINLVVEWYSKKA
jgi:small subunit ribosomal protein S4